MAARILLVGWDAADWKILHPLIDAGEMPALRRIVETGASGALLCSQPPVSAVQWTSLLTGKRPWQHRICHPVGATAERRCSLTLWEMLAEAGKPSLIVGWPATHGERTDRATIVSDCFAIPTAAAGVKPWPPPPVGTYWPQEIGARLNTLRMSPTDVQADVISRYVPEWRKIDQQRNRRIGQLRLFLATDFSYQAAMMKLMAESEWDFAAVRFPALGAISQLFLPYHPPRKESVPEVDFRLFQNVISAACRMLDEMLHSLVQTAGKNTSVIVVSEHGVNPRHLSPGRSADNEAWTSPCGIFAASGPLFAEDALVIGASVLDVTPTVLTSFALPIGDDMEGRVLLEAFAKPPEVARVASWESDQRSTAAADIAQPLTNAAKTAAIQREWDWNLARSYLEAGLPQEALLLLEKLFRAFPERADVAQALFRCQLALQKCADASETLQVLLEKFPPGIWQLLPQIELCVARKQTVEARALVNKAWNLHPTHPEAMRRLGMLLLRLREWDALEQLAKQALELDDNEPLAWLGLAEAKLRKRMAPESEEAALRAIALNYYMPDAHFILARSLVAQGRWQEAGDAIQTLLKLQPENRAAAIYAQRLPKQTDSPPTGRS